MIGAIGEEHFCPECFDRCDCMALFCTHCADDDTYDADWNDYDANDGTEG